jgi:hypothetical protein
MRRTSICQVASAVASAVAAMATSLSDREPGSDDMQHQQQSKEQLDCDFKMPNNK